MHASSMDKMRTFREKYLGNRDGERLRILDLGAQSIFGNYRELFSCKNWEYLGIDILPGDNVDLVLTDSYSWREVESESVDVLISGQAFEHIEFFWLTMGEVARVLKPAGICCIIAPSRGHEHRYPVDCWRFFSDGFRALARYAGLEVLEASTQWENQGYDDGSDAWGDSILVARKPPDARHDEKENIASQEKLGRIHEKTANGLAYRAWRRLGRWFGWWPVA